MKLGLTLVIAAAALSGDAFIGASAQNPVSTVLKQASKSAAKVPKSTKPGQQGAIVPHVWRGADPSAPGIHSHATRKTLQASFSPEYYASRKVLSAQEITFEVDKLLLMWRLASFTPATLDFLGTATSLSRFSESSNGRFKYFLFEARDHDGWLNLTVNANTKVVGGYALLSGAHYDIIPTSDWTGKGTYLLVQTAPAAASPTDDTFSRAKIGALYKTCGAAKPMSVSEPLTLLIGYTRTAEQNITSSNDGRMGVEPLTGGIANNLSRAFERAGVTADVEAHDPFPVHYSADKPISQPTKNQPALSIDGEAFLAATLTRLLDDKDKSLSDFRAKRNELKADIGLLVVDINDTNACGVANLRASANQAFAVVNWRCIGNQYSAEHEIGHVLGMHHEEDPTASPKFATAFVQSSPSEEHPFMTLMGEGNNCKGKRFCYRALQLSNPDDTHKPSGGKAIVIGRRGLIDNACLLRQSLPVAARFGETL